MQLNFESLGTGRPIIILHGLFGSLDNWRTVARNFAAHFQVISVDLRNHGCSPHEPTMTYEIMAEDVLELMQSHALKEVDIIGHSMGGKTAMELALTHPQKVRRLVVVDITPKLYPRGHDHILDALLSLDLSRYETRQQMEEILIASIPERAVVRFLLKSVSRDGNGRFQWLLGLREIAANYDSLVAGLAPGRTFLKPTMLMRGEHSHYVDSAGLAVFREMFPGANVSTVRGASHWVHAEAPAEFMRLVRQFLAG